MYSEISRKLSKKTTIKKIINRFSWNFEKIQSEQLFENYIHAIKSQINKSTILIIDGSDITKNYTKKAECIATVRDSSTGEYKFDYHTME